MSVRIVMPLLAAGIYTVVFISGFLHTALIKCHHIGVYLVNIRGMREIHHIGRIAAGRTHIDFESRELSLLPKTLTRLSQAEKFKVNKAAVHSESPGCPAPDLPQLFRHIRAGVIHEVKVIIYDIHDRHGPDGHILKQRLIFGIQDRLI